MQDITKAQMREVAESMAERMDTDDALSMLAAYFVAEYEKDRLRYHEDAQAMYEWVHGPDGEAEDA